jgi:tetratricopeptide (TPR) repeat protein
MNLPRNALLLSLLAACVAPAQNTPETKPSDRAAAYYNFAMGHLYSEMAGAYGNRGDYFNKAIDFYKAALKLDPSATFLSEELTDLYIQAGRIKDAVTEAEELLKQNPENLEARRLLGRIYARLIGDPQQNRINEEMLKRAIEQYQKITSTDDKDQESWLMLGRLDRLAHNSPEAEKAYKQVLTQDSGNEEALLGLAMVYSDVGDTKNAIDMLRQVTVRNPNARTLATLASFYEQSRDYDNAADVWGQALAMEPDNARIKRALAQNLLFIKRYEDALKLYGEIAAADPRDFQVQLRISEIYREKHDFAKARAAFAKAKEIDRDNIEVRYDEVSLLEDEGKPEEAVRTLKALVDETAKKSYTDSEKNSRAMLLERLGRLYRNSNKYTTAVETFRQIAVLDPDAAPRASVEIVETLRIAKDFVKAQEEADAALKKFPKDRIVKLAHASLAADMGKVDQAAEEVRSLLAGERDRDTYVALAQIYEKGKRYDEMTAALDEAGKLSTSKPEQIDIAFMRGAMFERMKKFDASESEFRKVLELDPDNGSALNYLGYMLADRNIRLDEADKMIRKAVQLEPQNGAYLDSLGWLQYRQNKLEEAATSIRQALEKMTKDPTIHDHLGDIYFAQGKLKEAIAQWQASLKEYETSAQAEADPVEVAKINKKLEGARVRVAQEGSVTKNGKR